MAATVEDAVGTKAGAGEKGLKGGALGLVSSIVVGVASTAPAYSLAASLGYVVLVANGDGIVGTKAPAIMRRATASVFSGRRPGPSYPPVGEPGVASDCQGAEDP